VNFGLSEEQQLLQETVRGFVAGECPVTRVREIFDAGSDHDPALWQGLVDMGIAGLVVPEEHGGAGLELLELALVAEELGAGAVPSPFFGHCLATLAVVLAGSDEQRRRWLPSLADGSRLATLAFGEPGEVWDPGDFRTAVTEGEVAGTKTFVTSSDVADLFVVGVAGGGLAVVENGSAGVKVEPHRSVDRTRRSGRVQLEGAACEPLPRPLAGRVRDAGLVLLAADALGGAWRLVEMSTEYARNRRQFGRAIAEFQAVKHQLADMAIDVEPARAVYWYAAHAFDHIPAEAEHAAAMAKAHITDRYTQASRDAVEIHGGIGLTWECDVHIWLKRSLFDRAVLGNPDLHRERCAALSGW
jgi:alkylation response protein AidB-like acyl-CoA dehydrogenase